MVPAPSTATLLMSVFTAGFSGPPPDPRWPTPASGRALVHAVDDVLVLRLHHAALDLEGGSHLSRLEGELVGDQGDLLDLLELGEVGGEVAHELVVEGHHLGL